MRAYLRPDGRYDVIPDSVVPEVISAEEYENRKHRDELQLRKAELLKELAAIDAELNPGATENMSTPTPVEAPVVVRKRW